MLVGGLTGYHDLSAPITVEINHRIDESHVPSEIRRENMRPRERKMRRGRSQHEDPTLIRRGWIADVQNADELIPGHTVDVDGATATRRNPCTKGVTRSKRRPRGTVEHLKRRVVADGNIARTISVEVAHSERAPTTASSHRKLP